MREAIKWLFRDAESRWPQNVILALLLSITVLVTGFINQLWGYQLLLSVYVATLLTIAADQWVRQKSAADCRVLDDPATIRHELGRFCERENAQILIGADLEPLIRDLSDADAKRISGAITGRTSAVVRLVSDSPSSEEAWKKVLGALLDHARVRVVPRFDDAVCAFDGECALVLMQDSATETPRAIFTSNRRLAEMFWALFVDGNGSRRTSSPLHAGPQLRAYLQQIQEEYLGQVSSLTAESVEIRSEVAALDLYARLMTISSTVRAIDSVSLDSYIRGAVWSRLYALERPELQGLREVQRILVVPQGSLMSGDTFDAEKTEALRTIHETHISRGFEIKYLAGSMGVFADSGMDSWMSRTTGWMLFDEQVALWTQTGQWNQFGGYSARLYRGRRVLELREAFDALFTSRVPHAPLFASPDDLLAHYRTEAMREPA